MLGYIHKNNDIFLFFENDELLRLRGEKIKGSYVQVIPEERGELEIVIDEETGKRKMELIGVTKTCSPPIYLIHIRLMQRVYEQLQERGHYELHEGFRHINIREVNRLDFENQRFYESLKIKYNPH